MSALDSTLVNVHYVGYVCSGVLKESGASTEVERYTYFSEVAPFSDVSSWLVSPASASLFKATLSSFEQTMTVLRAELLSPNLPVILLIWHKIGLRNLDCADWRRPCQQTKHRLAQAHTLVRGRGAALPHEQFAQAPCPMASQPDRA